jgi:hypothetical protein
VTEVPSAAPTSARRALRSLTALWGVAGVVLLLLDAVHRLGTKALHVLQAYELTASQYALFAGWTVVIGYLEGYRGFQTRFAPRVVARAAHLAVHPRPLHVLLAPLYCMALLHATRRRLVGSWLLVAGIVAVVLLVRQLPQPYRGLIDGGVVFALAWGTLAIVVHYLRGIAGHAPTIAPDVPEPR